MSDHIYLVMYDISDNGKRQKIADLLQRYGYERMQLSIFTGLQPPHTNAALWKLLTQLINKEVYPEDKICCLAVSKENFENMKILGSVTFDMEYLSGKKQVMIISDFEG